MRMEPEVEEGHITNLLLPLRDWKLFFSEEDGTETKENTLDYQDKRQGI